VDSSTVLIIAIPALLVLAGIMVFATGRRRAATGTLSRETRKRDASAPAPASTPSDDAGPQIADEGRQRADEARRALGSGSAVPVAAGARTPAERGPMDAEELGVTRRQFFNRGILVTMALALGGFGASMLAFLWPTAAGGFGSKVKVNIGLKDILASVADKKEPLYYPEARTYFTPYPRSGLPKAKKVYAPQIYAGMEKGIVALYQKCPHLGCKVPFCVPSQWFECPCHGSKYNRVGEKEAGPAPRGMDRFAMEISGDSITVDTTQPFIGPAIGTNTTGQGAEGPHCH
jgi:cytochrome b6-f complex iron-sulfur subunit